MRNDAVDVSGFIQYQFASAFSLLFFDLHFPSPRTEFPPRGGGMRISKLSVGRGKRVSIIVGVLRPRAWALQRTAKLEAKERVAASNKPLQ